MMVTRKLMRRRTRGPSAAELLEQDKRDAKAWARAEGVSVDLERDGTFSASGRLNDALGTYLRVKRDTPWQAIDAWRSAKEQHEEFGRT